ncbi:MAG: isopenicillin N synthase-like dioxygenase [Planctomycetota bacterium]
MTYDDATIPSFDLRSLSAAIFAGEEQSDPRGDFQRLAHACREWGVFYLENTGLDEKQSRALEVLSRRFFALDDEHKHALRMELAGRAWRGYFPLGRELTSGAPDHKEGLYFGAELDATHPRVQAKTPLYGANLYPQLDGFATRVQAYMRELTEIGQQLLSAIAVALGSEADLFASSFTRDPLVLFRIFHYPCHADDDSWGVGAHSDYGLLTLLWQDDSGGLQVRRPGTEDWVHVPPVTGSLVCNLGDMMERLTGGRCHSLTHRVVAPTGQSRISMPFFLDPCFDAELAPFAERVSSAGDSAKRWDGESVHGFEGTYGQYLLRKVGRVFPTLRGEVLD